MPCPPSVVYGRSGTAEARELPGLTVGRSRPNRDSGAGFKVKFFACRDRGRLHKKGLQRSYLIAAASDVICVFIRSSGKRCYSSSGKKGQFRPYKVPWYDKLGVDTALDYEVVTNVDNPLLTDEEIDELVSKMPSFHELERLDEGERNRLIFSAYVELQAELILKRESRKRDPDTFDEVLYPQEWNPTSAETLLTLPGDAQLFHQAYARSLCDAAAPPSVQVEKFPRSPYGPLPSPLKLPDLKYWEIRQELIRASEREEFLRDFGRVAQSVYERIKRAAERRFPVVSRKSLGVAEGGSGQLAYAPKLSSVGLEVRRFTNRLMGKVEAIEGARKEVEVESRAGFEDYVWYSFNSRDWEEMSHDEFSYWRCHICQRCDEPAREYATTNHRVLSYTLRLRQMVDTWRGDYLKYEESVREVHLTDDQKVIWGYGLTQKEWYKSLSAFVRRLSEVEARVSRFRRRTVYNFLCEALTDYRVEVEAWLRDLPVVEKKGLDWIGEGVSRCDRSELEVFGEHGKLAEKWRRGIEAMALELQARKEENLLLELFEEGDELSQFRVDLIYQVYVESVIASMPKESELLRVARYVGLDPVELLCFVGEDAESGLFGLLLSYKESFERSEWNRRTLKRLEVMRRLVERYWFDHAERAPRRDENGQYILDYKKVSDTLIEREYLDILSGGVDLHAAYPEEVGVIEEEGVGASGERRRSVREMVERWELDLSSLSKFLALLQEYMGACFAGRREEERAMEVMWSAPERVFFVRDAIARSSRRIYGREGRAMEKRYEEVRFLRRRDAERAREELAGEEERLKEACWRLKRPPNWLVERMAGRYEFWRRVAMDERCRGERDWWVRDAGVRGRWELEEKGRAQRLNLLQRAEREEKVQSVYGCTVGIFKRLYEVMSKREESGGVGEELGGVEFCGAEGVSERVESELLTEVERESFEWFSQFDFDCLRVVLPGASELDWDSGEVEEYRAWFEGEGLRSEEFLEPPECLLGLEVVLNKELESLVGDLRVLARLEEAVHHMREQVENARKCGRSPLDVTLLRKHCVAWSVRHRVLFYLEVLSGDEDTAKWYEAIGKMKSRAARVKGGDGRALRREVSFVFYNWAKDAVRRSVPLSRVSAPTEGEKGVRTELEESLSQHAKAKGLLTELSVLKQQEELFRETCASYGSDVSRSESGGLEVVNVERASMSASRRGYWERELGRWRRSMSNSLLQLYDKMLEQRRRSFLSYPPMEDMASDGERYHLIARYLEREGRFEDALLAYQKAVYLDHVESMYVLGCLYLHLQAFPLREGSEEASPAGDARESSPRYICIPFCEGRGRGYLESAARRGHEESCLELAKYIFRVQDLPRYPLAFQVLSIAADELWSDRAALWLARAFETGEYGVTDLKRSILYYSRVPGRESRKKVAGLLEVYAQHHGKASCDELKQQALEVQRRAVARKSLWTRVKYRFGAS